MKLSNTLEIEENNVGELEELEASIDSKNIALILSLASKNLYSNPIGSIIREITSNCYDANKESGSDKPIRIYYEENKEDNTIFICFKDNGIGISPERFKQTYMMWFSSTKRDTNEQIGGKGIGSKTPLSYQDMFNITTINEGTKYEYILYKTNDKPKITKLSEVETNEPSGTTIKIEIKDFQGRYNSNDDLYKFNEECKKQLSYFEGVFVESYSWTYNNYFKIVEGKSFKYKSEDRPYEEMHICLGQVTYVIDWKILKLTPVKCPVAIKFEIGELDVTLSRENIEYNDDSIDLIKKRIDLATNELIEIYNNNSPLIADLKEFVSKRHKVVNIKLADDIEIDAKTLKLKSNYIYEPLKDFTKLPENLLMHYDVIKVFNGVIKSKYHATTNEILSSKIAIIKDFPSKYNNILFYNGYLLRRKKIDYKDLVYDLGLKKHISYYDLNRDSFYSKLASYTQQGYIHSVGKAKQVKKYIDTIDNYLKSIAVDYYQATPEYIKEYNRGLRDNSSIINRKLEGKLLYYEYVDKNIDLYTRGGWGRRGQYYKTELQSFEIKTEEKLENLAKFKFIFYRLKGENIPIKEFNRLLGNFSMYRNKHIKFLIISKTNERQLLKLGNAFHVNELGLIRRSSRLTKFKNYLCKVNLANSIVLHNEFDLKELSSYYAEVQKELSDFKDKWSTESCIDLSHYKNNKDYEIKTKIEELEKFIKKVDIFQYIGSNMPLEYQVKLAKLCKVTKLNTNLYKNQNGENNI